MSRSRTWIGGLVVAAVVVVAIAGAGAAQSASRSAASTHAYITHIAAGLADEPHVFVETAKGAATVQRPTKDTPPGTALFAAKRGTRIPFAEFFDPSRTYPKGAALDLTLGDWLGGRGSLKVVCRGGNATLSSRFSRLVPRGTYSLVDVRADKQGVPTRFRPLGGRRDGRNRVKADGRGRARHRIALSFCPSRVRDPMMIVALILHFDGRVHARSERREPTGTIAGVHLFTPVKG